MLTSDELKKFRQLAQDSVDDMPEGDLRTKAFEVILEHLLASETVPSNGGIAKDDELPKKQPKKGTQKSAIKTPKRDTLPSHIIKLRESGFFAEPRIAIDVHKELLPTYHCELNRVEVALTRLATKKHLRKATKNISDKEYRAYVW